MRNFIIYRSLRAILTIFVVITFVFVATRLTGDPTAWLLPDDATLQQRADLRSYLGIDKPIMEQYLRYLIGIIQGDFGEGFFDYRPVTEIYFERADTYLFEIIK